MLNNESRFPGVAEEELMSSSASSSDEYADVEDDTDSDAGSKNPPETASPEVEAVANGQENNNEGEEDLEDPRQTNRLRALRCRRDTVPRGRRPVDFYHECERRNARRFARMLASDLIPRVGRLRSSVEADEVFQKFASDYAVESCDPARMVGSGGESDRAILNADGVYLAMFSCLSLSLKLSLAGFYKEGGGEVILTEVS
jgi:hypothetical protein